MSGHSKWETIKRTKGANDAKRGVVFTKLANTIAVAARGGGDPEINFGLRLAIDKARAANMPMANIQRAIDRGSGKLGGEQIQEVLYEGYGPGGVGILVECATDNINRTYPEVKLAFSKHGGSIAEKGSVAFQFARKGMVRIIGKGEETLLTVLDSGAEDAVEEADEMVVYTDAKQLAAVRQSIADSGLEIVDAGLTYVPNGVVQISDAALAGKIMRLMEALESNDDVTSTYVNFDIAEGLML